MIGPFLAHDALGGADELAVAVVAAILLVVVIVTGFVDHWKKRARH
jgi:hypothetical protein